LSFEVGFDSDIGEVHDYYEVGNDEYPMEKEI